MSITLGPYLGEIKSINKINKLHTLNPGILLLQAGDTTGCIAFLLAGGNGTM